MISDTTIQALAAAMRGLSARRSAIQANVANMETAGYLARTVDFEGSLRQAIEAGDPGAMELSYGRSTAPTGPNGNNVAPDEQVVDLAAAQLAGQLMVEALNAKYRLLRAAMSNGA